MGVEIKLEANRRTSALGELVVLRTIQVATGRIEQDVEAINRILAVADDLAAQVRQTTIHSSLTRQNHSADACPPDRSMRRFNARHDAITSTVQDVGEAWRVVREARTAIHRESDLNSRTARERVRRCLSDVRRAVGRADDAAQSARWNLWSLLEHAQATARLQDLITDELAI